MPRNLINGVELYWELSGKSGEPLVLVHGSWIDHCHWDFLIPFLQDSFRILSYDRRGHSQSERPPQRGSIKDDLLDLRILLEHLDLAPAHILGNSYGAMLTLRLAVEHPELFRSIMIHEPPLYQLNLATSEHKSVATFIQLQGKVVELLESGQLELGTRMFIDAVGGPDAWNELSEDFRNLLIFNAPSFVDDSKDLEPWSVDLVKLSSISKPILLTQGENSPEFLLFIMSQLQQALPDARMITIQEAAHDPQITHPEEYAEIIKTFLNVLT